MIKNDILISMQKIQKGFYYHFKHNPGISLNNYAYKVIGTAKHSETEEVTVIYKPMYKNEWLGEAELMSRPIDMFLDTVEKPEYSGLRFRLIEDPEIIAKLSDIRDGLDK